MELYYNKYRPTTLNDFIGNEVCVELLSTMLQNVNCQNIMIVGQKHGIGKKTLVRLMLKSYFGERYENYFIELYGSIDRGKDTVSEYSAGKKKTDAYKFNMITFINKKITLPDDKLRIIVIYDFECMTEKAQFTLKGIIEDKSNRVRFIFVCNKLSNVLPAIQSRCTPISLDKIPDDLIITKLKHIHSLEQSTKNTDDTINDTINDTVYETIARIADGDMRKAMNYFQVCNNMPHVSFESLNNLFNIAPYDILAELFINCSKNIKSGTYLKKCVDTVNIFLKDGYNSNDLLYIILNILMTETYNIENSVRVKCLEHITGFIKDFNKSQSNIHLYTIFCTLLRESS